MVEHQTCNLIERFDSAKTCLANDYKIVLSIEGHIQQKNYTVQFRNKPPKPVFIVGIKNSCLDV